MTSRLFTFAGGDAGPWRILRIETVTGDPLPEVNRLEIFPGGNAQNNLPMWTLRGMASNDRYVTRPEKASLAEKQPPLGRAEATCAALIPIRKNAAWWNLTQNERRAVFEEQSRHIQIGLGYLPAIARKLHHCRDLSENEPFDFLTWFEYALEHEKDFDRMLAELRASEEWRYVDREIDIRLVRES